MKNKVIKVLVSIFLFYCSLMVLIMPVLIIIEVEERLDWGTFFKWLIPSAVVVAELFNSKTK